jgi:hypothetical protein
MQGLPTLEKYKGMPGLPIGIAIDHIKCNVEALAGSAADSSKRKKGFATQRDHAVELTNDGVHTSSAVAKPILSLRRLLHLLLKTRDGNRWDSHPGPLQKC